MTIATTRQFDPSRFLDTGLDESEVFIPQGGADVETGHRCPGEPGELITVGLLGLTAAELSVREYDAPAQDLSYSLRRVPTMPSSGVTLSG